jgi:hypothetical protein
MGCILPLPYGAFCPTVSWTIRSWETDKSARTGPAVQLRLMIPPGGLQGMMRQRAAKPKKSSADVDRKTSRTGNRTPDVPGFEN